MSLTREKLFARLGVIDGPGPNLHKRTIKIWSRVGREEMNDKRFQSSFWGGMFPAVSKPCGRHAMYKMLNLPTDEPPHPKLMATSQAGKDVENQITGMWRDEGLSIVGDQENQLRLQDPETWYSSALDDVLDLRPDCKFVVPVDVKTKKEDVINDMRLGSIEMDPRHRAQVLGYVDVCRRKHTEMRWDRLGLEPSEGGFVYYVSRDNPANGIAFWVEYDEEEVEKAVALLKKWKKFFTENELPERQKSWRWMEQPCKWCDFKKLCKQDVKDGVTDLFDSATITEAKRIDPEYDPQTVHARVLDRWKEDK